jgi:hypothetical protein
MESPTFADAQNLLTSNNITSVAVIDTNYLPIDALALFDGPPLNAYNAAPDLLVDDIKDIIIPVLESNIAYW